MSLTKVYVALPPNLEGHRATGRVAAALAKFAPDRIQVVDKKEAADLIVLHVIGYPETIAAADEALSSGQRYAMIQYCMRTTQRPSTLDWAWLWENAAVVWSYYDLRALIAEDDAAPAPEFPNFYHAPLGVDATKFRPWPTPRARAILTSGYVAETEGVREAHAAARRAGMRSYHLGPDLQLGDWVSCLLGLTDDQLAQQLSRVKYVAGLRRVEGFELPAAEGLLCGARPVMFDRPHYRRWFGDRAEYIPEGSEAEVTDALTALFTGPYREVTDEERDYARAQFDWRLLVAGFWDRAVPVQAAAPPIVVEAPRRKLLWVGDAGVSSGFARATHQTLDVLRRDWDVVVLGINYLGDPHPYPYPIYPCFSGGDLLGQKRLPKLVKDLKPDVVVLQNDPWNLPGYTKEIPADVLTVGVVAVDGTNCRGTMLGGLDLAIFWTEFGRQEAHAGGYAGASTVIPLGVDLAIYKPQDRAWAREAVLGDIVPGDAFIVGNVNRNQPRKRLDLTIAYFAEWVRTRGVRDAYLYLHVAPTGDVGYDLTQLMHYHLPPDTYGRRLILPEIEPRAGEPEAKMAAIYALMDVQLTTTQGEGFGLPALEGMACGIPLIAGDWAALGEWARPAAVLVPCPTTIATTQTINSIGGVPDRQSVVNALDALYRHPAQREAVGARSVALAREDRFRWANIGRAFHVALDGAWAARQATRAPEPEVAHAGH